MEKKCGVCKKTTLILFMKILKPYIIELAPTLSGRWYKVWKQRANNKKMSNKKVVAKKAVEKKVEKKAVKKSK